MKKTITNKQDATCQRCGSIGQPVMPTWVPAWQPVCGSCGSADLRDPRGKTFEPTYGAASTYRASKYTPEMPDRRTECRSWPLIRERRAAYL